MRKFVTAICCLSMAYLGYKINNMSEVYTPQNTLQAATIQPMDFSRPTLSLKELIAEAKELKIDTVRIHDTITVSETKTKYIRIPAPKNKRDTIYVPISDLPGVECVGMNKIRSPGEEEQPADETTKPSSVVILSIDGKVVYSSESVSDEP